MKSFIRHRFLLLFLVSLLFSEGRAQWYWNHPSLGVGYLNDIAVVDDDVWWTVGRYGQVFRTLDGGETWEQRHLYTDVDLRSVCFSGDDLGWIAGGEGKVFYTLDGGDHWDVVYAGYNLQLNDIIFADDAHGWIVGENGTIFHSEDGGMNWELQGTPGVNHDLGAITFINTEEGWACGEYGTVLHTEDGGTTWVQQAQGSWDHNYQGIYFRDNNVGWVVGRIHFFSYTSGILKTSNGGTTWSITDSLPDCSEMTSIHFIDEDIGFAGGWNNLYKTDDGGTNWYPLTTEPGFYPGAIATSQEKLVLSGGYGYLVENACDVLVSDDMGATWQTNNNQVVGSEIRVVEAIDSLHVWFMHNSADKHLFRTENGGETWEQVMTTPGYYFRDLSFITPDQGWAILHHFATNSNKMVMTDDGGDTWDTLANIVGGINVYGLQFRSETHGWLLAHGEGIYRTQDGGSAWELCLSQGPYIGKAYFIDEQRGWAPALGSDLVSSILFSTTDGGTTWVPDTVGNYGLGAVYFLDEERGWFTRDNKILRTTNGGASWIETTVPGVFGLSRVTFIDSLTGWAYENTLEETSNVFISTDGGITWEKDHAASENGYFYDMDFDGSGNGWLVGSNGKILKRGMGDLLTTQQEPPREDIIKKGLSVFPNPFSTGITLDLPAGMTGSASISLFDLQGRKVLGKQIPAGAPGRTITVDAAALENGLFFIEFSMGGFHHVQKIIKRK